jgi:tetratricopeptide (TPR) repeat protein
MGNSVGHSQSPDDALPWFDKTVELLTPLLKQNRNSKGLVEVLVEAHARRGWILSAFLKKHAEALQAYDRALELNKGIDSDWLVLYRACAVARQGKHKEGVETAEQIVNKTSVSASNLSNAACVYGLAATSVKKDDGLPEAERAKLADLYGARAVQLLIKALEAGYFKNLAKDDPRITVKDFDSLRERSDFQDFLKQLKEKK